MFAELRRGLLLLGLVLTVPAAAQDLPPGPGRDDIARRCVVCHDTDLIAQQRLTAVAWGRELDKMARWGALVEPSRRDDMVAYLARHFGPMPTAAAAANPGAERTYEVSCRVCHEHDLIEAQRLGTAGWTREVEKMMRWGAALGGPEKQPLIEYLAARFPAPPPEP